MINISGIVVVEDGCDGYALDSSQQQTLSKINDFGGVLLWLALVVSARISAKRCREEKAGRDHRQGHVEEEKSSFGA